MKRYSFEEGNSYREIFGSKATFFSRAPGRVNLIGEHTDYNDGFCLPTAIDRSVIFSGELRDDKKIIVFSENYSEKFELELSELKSCDRINHWSDYLVGILKEFQVLNLETKGFQAVCKGNVPEGSGLSSSAAIEVAFSFFLNGINDFKLEKKDLALLSQRAENNFVGVKCGVMDQLVSALAIKNNAIFIDCRNLETEYIPFNFKDYSIVIVNSNVSRELGSETFYNERREQCREGVRILKKILPDISALRDVTEDEFIGYENELPVVIRKRCRHVITENERVKKSIEWLGMGKIEEFGKLMIKSHESLRDDYEVSIKELDKLVEISLSVDGCIGSRMTGAGFGGCTVSIVNKKSLKSFEEIVKEKYFKFTAKKCEVYVTSTENGAEFKEI